MQRCNFVGWLSRPQFEERWMQLLGVVNQPPPQEGEFPEEYHAYTLNVCAGTLNNVIHNDAYIIISSICTSTCICMCIIIHVSIELYSTVGVQAVTSLLLSTLLRPTLGDPTSSVPMHTPRSLDLLFLGTRCSICECVLVYVAC